MTKSFKITVVISVLIIATIVALSVYRGKKEVAEIQHAPVLVDGWKTYANEQYGYEIRYPENTIVTESLENDIFTQELDLALAEGQSAFILVSLPKSPQCGRYGPGVASQRIYNEPVSINGKTEKMFGWAEVPENYRKWEKENQDFIYPTQSKYSKTLNWCDNTSGKFSIVTRFEVEDGDDSEEINEVETLVKKVISSFKLNE